MGPTFYPLPASSFSAVVVIFWVTAIFSSFSVVLVVPAIPQLVSSEGLGDPFSFFSLPC